MKLQGKHNYSFMQSMQWQNLASQPRYQFCCHWTLQEGPQHKAIMDAGSDCCEKTTSDHDQRLSAARYAWFQLNCRQVQYNSGPSMIQIHVGLGIMQMMLFTFKLHDGNTDGSDILTGSTSLQMRIHSMVYNYLYHTCIYPYSSPYFVCSAPRARREKLLTWAILFPDTVFYIVHSNI